ncbi:restriction endonuclease [Erysipelothrix sp. HDW6B]|uniref:type II restriction endonuclease n=1 Tax=Erysipelothrix sp. HDW6B TaxID=2714929 RepID=UPI00140A8DC9|nr:type II restriction endonuclease [Erysipelothrix sp. HDW6B]QIK86607.1 restriction endonuclease [Erysipelothrix sp. HDW6B]
MERDFDEWISGFKDSIATWEYYVDFPKVYNNVEKIKVELNLLNSLIGSEDIENEFKDLLSRYPEIIKVIPILIAKREKEIRIIDVEGDFNFNFKQMNYTVDEYCLFMRNTGIFDLLQRHIIRDLTDYVKGVEVGMDTNGRKNRTGHSMEDLVEGYIQRVGFIKNVSYFKELTKTNIEKMFGLDLSNISNQGKSEKRFDFVIKTDNSIYAIETNFYGSGGSKLNETARSYEMLATQSATIEGLKFVWITDGRGWLTARNNLRQTFDMLKDIYNIADLESGILNTTLI